MVLQKLLSRTESPLLTTSKIWFTLRARNLCKLKSVNGSLHQACVSSSVRRDVSFCHGPILKWHRIRFHYTKLWSYLEKQHAVSGQFRILLRPFSSLSILLIERSCQGSLTSEPNYILVHEYACIFPVSSPSNMRLIGAAQTDKIRLCCDFLTWKLHLLACNITKGGNAKLLPLIYFTSCILQQITGTKSRVRLYKT